MSKLQTWFNINKLSLNLSQKKMLFGNCRKITKIKVQIDGLDIERVKENKFLGVTIDENLNWKPHIKYLKSKFSRTITEINNAKQVLNDTSHCVLFTSLTISKLLC